MAQEIQVPQSLPNAPQFQVPTDLVNAYLARKQNEQKMFLGAVGDVGDTVNAMRQQKITNQLNALAAYASIAKAVGPDSANQVAGQIPNMPNWNGVQQPQAQPSQVSPTPQTNVGLMGGNPSASATPTAQTQGQPSPYIAASLALGHPDVTGYQQRMGQLNQQMAQFNNKGDWGREQAQQTAGQIQGVKAESDLAQVPLSIAEKEASIRASNAKFANPTQGNAIASGDPNAVGAAYGGQAPVEAYNNAAAKQMEVKKTVAGEISKTGQSAEQIGQIRQLYSDLQDALVKSPPSLGATLSGKANQLSGGRIGSQSAANVLNAANPLATALNTELSRRFNSGEVQLLNNSLIPQPIDTQAMRDSKMQHLGHIISAMESGNEQNVTNVANAITGGKINTTILPTRVPTQQQATQATPAITSKAQYDALPNGASYTFNGQPHVKGKS